MLKRRGMLGMLSLLIAAIVLGFTTRAQAGPTLNGQSFGHGTRADAGKIVGQVVDTAGAPVAEAEVWAFKVKGPGFKKGKTGEKGGFDLGEVAPGAWIVKAAKKDVGFGQAKAEVKAGETTKLMITLMGKQAPAPGKIVGIVIDDQGEPVADANVSIGAPGSGPGGQKTKSNEKGVFVFEKVKPGKVVVFGAKEGVGAGKAEVAVKPGETAEVKIVIVPKQPPAAGKIVGIVVDEAGNPVALANVKIGPPGPGGLMTKTNEKGEFAFEKVKVGKAVVFAEKMGVGKGAVETTVEAGKTSEVKIMLKK
jgi:Carboxypeptidase regulatory-like domain